MANKSISEAEIENEIYEIKDRTAREHLIEVKGGDVPPESEDNRLWIKPMTGKYVVPDYQEFIDVRDIVARLDVPLLTEEELDEICRGGDE